MLTAFIVTDESSHVWKVLAEQPDDACQRISAAYRVPLDILAAYHDQDVVDADIPIEITPLED